MAAKRAVAATKTIGSTVVGREHNERSVVNAEFSEFGEYLAGRPVDFFHRVTVYLIGTFAPKLFAGVELITMKEREEGNALRDYEVRCEF